jgi:hypothetical protein
LALRGGIGLSGPDAIDERAAKVCAFSRGVLLLDLRGEGSAKLGPDFAQPDCGRRVIDGSHKSSWSRQETAALLHEVEYAAREREYSKSEHTVDYNPPIPGTVDSSLIHRPLI